MNKFCAEGTTEAKCYNVEPISFSSEEKILDVVLDILKSELPARLNLIKDCEDNPMYISEDSIDILPPESFAHFNIILNPVSDRPNYTENRLMRTVAYNFELILTVSSSLKRCVTWELIRFKNVVEELMMATDLYIDGYNSVDIDPQGFQYTLPTVDSGIFRRQGAYRFAVTVTQVRN